MRAVVLHEFGPAENLTYETIPDPVPAEGQVRITVEAAGVHLVETAMRAGLAIGPPLPELPAVFGGEVAGVVDAVGPGVDASWIGARVVTAGGSPGGYAELAVTDVADLHLVPDQLRPESAVTMIVTGTTTIGVLAIADLSADDVVLVNSAAGGIGRLLVQYARRLGATVIGAAGGPAKVSAVEELGADLAVDYDRDGWAAIVRQRLGERPVTIVLDGVGGDKAAAAFDLIGDGGRFVSYGAASRQEFTPDPAAVADRHVRAVDALGRMLAEQVGPARATDERKALEAAADGSLVPYVQTFPLARAAEAHAALESRATTGKVVLVP